MYITVCGTLVKQLGHLKKNKLADQSDLIIYSDGPKNYDNRSKVIEIRDNLRTVDGFNSLRIIERKKNFGLAVNIVEGVTEIVKKYHPLRNEIYGHQNIIAKLK